jgi:hypothetical protein
MKSLGSIEFLEGRSFRGRAGRRRVGVFEPSSRQSVAKVSDARELRFSRIQNFTSFGVLGSMDNLSDATLFPQESGTGR